MSLLNYAARRVAARKDKTGFYASFLEGVRPSIMATGYILGSLFGVVYSIIWLMMKPPKNPY